MKTQALVLAFAAVFLPRYSFADPPVNVEIADDEAEDFFSSEPAEEEEAADPKDSRSRIKKNADAMFEELEATQKGAKIKRAKKSRGDDRGEESDNDNSNINQNVVNVVVVSGDKDTKAEAKAEVAPTIAPAVAPVEQPLRSAETSKPAATVAQTSCCNSGFNTWSSWWERSPGLDSGDVLVSFSSGGYGGGLYLGMGLEGMLSDTFGIKLAVNGTGFDRWDEHHEGLNVRTNQGDWDFFLGGKSVAPQPAHNASVDRAVLHLEDLSLVMHLGDGDGIDIFPSFGVSHFGYYIDTGSREWAGGSAFLRAGVGAQWVYKRFFAGVELGWYPVELARYGIVDRSGGGKEAVAQHIDDSTDRKRVTFNASFGLSL